LGFGVWGFGFWVLGIGPNPQSPIPICLLINNLIYNILNLLLCSKIKNKNINLY